MYTDIKFEWDPVKALRNWHKHGVSFQEAISAFYDPFVLYQLDLGHSEDEERIICLGMTHRGVLLVIFTERQEGSRIRIISSRLATKRECERYETQNA